MKNGTYKNGDDVSQSSICLHWPETILAVGVSMFTWQMFHEAASYVYEVNR